LFKAVAYLSRMRTVFLLLLLCFVFLQACEGTFNDTFEQPTQPPPKVNAGKDTVVIPGNVNIVRLKGSAITTLANQSLGYQWNLLGKPAASKLILDSVFSRTPEVSFIPDVLGNYQLQLRATDICGQTGIDTVKVSFSNPTACTPNFPAFITNDFTFTDKNKDGSDPNNPDYVICQDVVISGGFTSIEPGTVIYFRPGIKIRVQRAASFSSKGDDKNPVILRNDPTAGASWAGILIESDASGDGNQFRYTQVLNAGGSVLDAITFKKQAAIGVALFLVSPTATVLAPGKVVIRDATTISGSKGFGIFAESVSGLTGTLDIDNTVIFSGNALGDIGNGIVK
jgi:hypothetical protein